MSQIAAHVRRLAFAALLALCAVAAHADDPVAQDAMVNLAQRLAAQPASPTRESLPLGPAAATGGGGASTAPTAPTDSSWLINTAIALAAVLGLIFVFRGVLQRAAGRTAASARHHVVEVLARVPVANRSNVLLLRTGSRILVVGESSAGLTTLCDITDPDEIGAILAAVGASQPRSISRGFAELFQRLSKDYREHEQVAEEGGDDSEYAVGRARDGLSGLVARVRSMAGGGAAS